MKQLIIFDPDGTLTESKSLPDAGMGALLAAILKIMQVAVISVGSWPQYQSQCLPGQPDGADQEKPKRVVETVLASPETSGVSREEGRA